MGLFDFLGLGVSEPGGSILDSLGVGDSSLSFLSDASRDLLGYDEPQASQAMISPGGAGGALVPYAAAGGAMVARGVSRFPMLRGAVMEWAAKGVRLTPEKLYAMLRKFGPTFLINAGILSAAAVADLMMYRATHRRRRMNPLNPRALSRATRRLCSFDRRAAKVRQRLGSLAKKKGKAFC